MKPVVCERCGQINILAKQNDMSRFLRELYQDDDGISIQFGDVIHCSCGFVGELPKFWWNRQPYDPCPVEVYLSDKSPKSKSVLRCHLRTVSQLIGVENPRDCDWARLRFNHIPAIQTELRKEFARKTCNDIISAIRGVMRCCYSLGYIGAPDYYRAVATPGLGRKNGDRDM